MKLLYILIFAVANTIIYIKLNKPGNITNKQFCFFIAFLFVFAALHFLNLPFLLPSQSIIQLIFIIWTPAIVYFWFKFIVLRSVNTDIANENFKSFCIKAFSVFFLNVPYIFAFIMECGVIMNPQNFK
ncbi:MAG: hypothetical protein JWQ85_3302 [Mucilaginibacter sp.]|nr:hypothetical protein [Mucilaginibacter sp.]